eukprot:TRINITY_DN4128_c0_g1_i4.p1 TRINITY_DN4128_c0_g1~~TRINITY_DN4128_c0_g1_i4.p1  ORF type:complete len:163 (+),score=52.92 TRINITY_DN4128_c0_g1_i4:80-568(+)
MAQIQIAPADKKTWASEHCPLCFQWDIARQITKRYWVCHSCYQTHQGEEGLDAKIEDNVRSIFPDRFLRWRDMKTQEAHEKDPNHECYHVMKEDEEYAVVRQQQAAEKKLERERKKKADEDEKKRQEEERRRRAEEGEDEDRDEEEEEEEEEDEDEEEADEE